MLLWMGRKGYRRATPILLNDADPEKKEEKDEKQRKT